MKHYSLLLVAAVILTASCESNEEKVSDAAKEYIHKQTGIAKSDLDITCTASGDTVRLDSLLKYVKELWAECDSLKRIGIELCSTEQVRNQSNLSPETAFYTAAGIVYNQDMDIIDAINICKDKEKSRNEIDKFASESTIHYDIEAKSLTGKKLPLSLKSFKASLNTSTDSIKIEGRDSYLVLEFGTGDAAAILTVIANATVLQAIYKRVIFFIRAAYILPDPDF